MTHPTDALRLVPNMPTVELTDDMLFKIETGETVTYGEMKRRLTAAPASPLPEGGGQCSGITGELDPRLVEWGYTSLDEAITHLGKLLDDQTAFDGLGELIAELKAGKAAVEELLYVHTDKSIAMGQAFLARNGKGEGQ